MREDVANLLHCSMYERNSYILHILKRNSSLLDERIRVSLSINVLL
jgi:hypothetical protein